MLTPGYGTNDIIPAALTARCMDGQQINVCIDLAQTYSFDHASPKDRKLMLGLIASFVLHDAGPSSKCSSCAANACCTAGEGRAPSTCLTLRPSTQETTSPIPAMPHARAMKRSVAQLGRLDLDIAHISPQRAHWKKVFQIWHHTDRSIFRKAVGGALVPVRASSGFLDSGKGL